MSPLTRSLLFCLIFFTSASMAAGPGWLDSNGKIVPDSDEMKSVDGFGGWLVVTPDKDWEQKWNTPVEYTPNFSTSETVEYGEELTILLFFTNPKPDEQGRMNLRCDIRVTRPNKTFSIDATDLDCASWEVLPYPHNFNVQLTQLYLKYVGDEGDPPGRWLVEVSLTDQNAGITVPLKTQFTLIERQSVE